MWIDHARRFAAAALLGLLAAPLLADSIVVSAPALPPVFSEQTLWTPRSLKAGVAGADESGFGKIFRYHGAGRVLEVAHRPLALEGLTNNAVPPVALFTAAPEAESFQYDEAQNLLRRTEREDQVATTTETPRRADQRQRQADREVRIQRLRAPEDLRRHDAAADQSDPQGRQHLPDRDVGGGLAGWWRSNTESAKTR